MHIFLFSANIKYKIIKNEKIEHNFWFHKFLILKLYNLYVKCNIIKYNIDYVYPKIQENIKKKHKKKKCKIIR